MLPHTSHCFFGTDEVIHVEAFSSSAAVSTAEALVNSPEGAKKVLRGEVDRPRFNAWSKCGTHTGAAVASLGGRSLVVVVLFGRTVQRVGPKTPSKGPLSSHWGWWQFLGRLLGACGWLIRHGTREPNLFHWCLLEQNSDQQHYLHLPITRMQSRQLIGVPLCTTAALLYLASPFPSLRNCREGPVAGVGLEAPMARHGMGHTGYRNCAGCASQRAG